MNLKQQLQKTEEDIVSLYKEKRKSNEETFQMCIDNWDDETWIKYWQGFIHQEQIDAIKAFVEELQPFLYQYPGTSEIEVGHNEAVQNVQQAINSLLRDI